MTDFGQMMARYTELSNNRAELLFEIEEKKTKSRQLTT